MGKRGGGIEVEGVGGGGGGVGDREVGGLMWGIGEVHGIAIGQGWK